MFLGVVRFRVLRNVMFLFWVKIKLLSLTLDLYIAVIELGIKKNGNTIIVSQRPRPMQCHHQKMMLHSNTGVPPVVCLQTEESQRLPGPSKRSSEEVLTFS